MSAQNWNQGFVKPLDAFKSGLFGCNDGEVIPIIVVFEIVDKGLDMDEFSNRGSSRVDVVIEDFFIEIADIGEGAIVKKLFLFFDTISDDVLPLTIWQGMKIP